MSYTDARYKSEEIAPVDLIIWPQSTSKVKQFYRDQIRTISFGFWDFGYLYKNAYNSETVWARN